MMKWKKRETESMAGMFRAGKGGSETGAGCKSPSQTSSRRRGQHSAPSPPGCMEGPWGGGTAEEEQPPRGTSLPRVVDGRGRCRHCITDH